ncbi:MAG: 50S ribosome-binding GTPase [Bacteroidales bacterium]|nr:50S ribosome-binding GTPase [Bacteroidales bacterium]
MDNLVIPVEGLVEKFEAQFTELKNEIINPNIMILGQTGVGKSSLINTVFGKDIATIGNTVATTRGFHKFTDKDIPVNIIDSEGYELEKAGEFKEMIEKYINVNFDDITKQIHLAWYCINVSNSRVFQYDIDNLQFLLSKNIPTCVVLTQCDNDTPEGTYAKSLSQVINDNFKDQISCFQVSNDNELNKSLDLEKLINWSQNNLNEENLRLGFIVAQKRNLDLKQEKISTRIKWYGASAAGVAATPIPVSDAPLLVGLQVKMCADIFKIYGLDNNVSGTIKNIIGGEVVSLLGKTLAGNLLKLIPGIGSVGGALINASVASSITISMGFAISKLTKSCIEHKLTGKFIEKLPVIFNQENLNKLINEFNSKNKKEEDKEN